MQRFLGEDLSNYLRGYELYGTVCTAIYKGTIIQANLPRNRKTHCNHRKGRSRYDDCQLRVVGFGAKMNEERLSFLFPIRGHFQACRWVQPFQCLCYPFHTSLSLFIAVTCPSTLSLTFPIWVREATWNGKKEA